jgi:hypothetical protein
LINNEKFGFEQVMKEGQKIILLRGIIDEDVTFDALAKLGSPLSFNFKGVTSINSCGVRTWVNFVKSIPEVEVTYEECPPLIVRQMNMVPSFVGHGKVKSVYVPYVCDACESESLALVHENEFASVAETMPCENCKKGEMEFDGRPEQYFAFSK